MFLKIMRVSKDVKMDVINVMDKIVLNVMLDIG